VKDLSLLDFESEPIMQRPAYPPLPVGLAGELPGQNPVYAAFGHLTNNGVYVLKGKKLIKLDHDPKKYAVIMYKEACKGSILGHDLSKFDVDVGTTHFKVKPPPWHKVHDSLYTRFLVDPHAPNLKLKDSAERILGEKPTERDAVYDWLAQHGWIQGPRKKAGKLVYPKNAGAMIYKAPGDLAALYAIGDLFRSKALFDHDYKKVCELDMQAAYDRERKLAPILLENERRGMRVNVPRLEKDLKMYEAALVKVQRWLSKRLHAPVSINWDSDDEIAVVLKKSGVVKEFPKTPTGKDSVSKSNLTMEFYSDRRVYLAFAYRNILAYVLSQNLRPWLEQAQISNGYIYTQWSATRTDHDSGARSGRITCGKWQNIIKVLTESKDPDFTEEGYQHIMKFIGLPELPLARVYCLPDEDELFCHNDWNQQELRLVAHYEDGALAEAYRNDPNVDIHGYVKDLIKKATGREFKREFVKLINFRTVYGGGASGLAVKLRIAYHEAKRMISDWKTALPDVVELDRELKDRFYAGKHLRTFGGRVYYCKPPSVAKKGPRKGQLISFEYTALNYLIQPSGADLIKMAVINYHEHPKRKGRMLNAVHDELNTSAPKKAAALELKVMKECMESITIDVPWRTDGDLRPSWGEKAKAA
jgi:DNA polymerase I-like protein with 3'-5' exonuclease and polymerase domains